jgi:DNA ligase-1
MIFPPLFKRTSTGAIQVWYQEVEGDSWRTISGQIDGLKVTSGWHKCQPKNTGKKNGTTAEEQAILEVRAKYKKKLELDYFESVEDVDNDIYFKPMLAAKYNDRVKKINFKTRAWTQPKLDGMRCVVTMSGMFSRAGKRVLSAPHIHEYMLANGYWDVDDSRVYDGELYNHELHEDFDELMSIARRTKPAEEDLAKSRKMLQFHIYDVTSDTEQTFAERFVAATRLNSECGIIQYVRTDEVSSLEEIDANYEQYLEANYEGEIVRIDDTYRNKRCNTLLKRKEFIDEEYDIVDIVEGKGNRGGIAGRVTLK